MAYEVARLKSVVGNTIVVYHPDIPESPETNLTASVAALDTTLPVLDNTGFADADYLVIGRFGTNKTEIVSVNGAVTAGTSLAVTALVFAHPVDTEIKEIIWNQIEITGAATATGSKTVIATVSLQMDRDQTVYVNTGTIYAYYFARYKNSTTTTYSEYSDATVATGFPTNSVRYVKDQALGIVNEKLSDLITNSWLNDQIFACEQEVWSQKKQWSWAYTFDSILADTVEGGYRVAMPTNAADQNSNKGVLSVRVKDRANLTYLTKEEWDRNYRDVTHTTLSTNVELVDVTVVLTDSSDFDSSGSILIGSDSISYTGNTVSTGTLTGVTGISATHTAADDVWQGATFSEPSGYTIFGGYIYFDRPVNSTYAAKNIYISYYRKPTAIDSDTDTVNIPDWSVYTYFLAWRILLRKANGVPTAECEAMRGLYEQRKDILMRRDKIQRLQFTPRKNQILYSNEDQQLISSNPQA